MNEQQKHYFSQEGLQNLKTDIELVFVIGADHKLVKKGSRFFAKCPMHQDQKHSLVISPKKNMWYCFGDCKRGGTIVDWVMASQRLKLVEALAFLAEQYPFLAQKGQVGGLGLNEPLPEDHQLAHHQQISRQIIGHYQSCINRDHNAIRYLRSIGIGHKVIRKYQLGFCNSTLAEALLKHIEEGDTILRDEMVEAGMLKNIKAGKIKERFHEKIVMPLFEEHSGQLCQIYGREVPKKIKIALVQTMVS